MHKLLLTAAAAVLGAALAAAPAAAQTLEKIKQRGVIVVGSKADYKPYGFRDPSGAIVGFEPDIARLVAEKLGVKLELSPEQLRRCVDSANICFAFARYHHPAMKFVGNARTSLGIPTIFNLLGPLTNPARAKHQLLGVFARWGTPMGDRVARETADFLLRELRTP